MVTTNKPDNNVRDNHRFLLLDLLIFSLDIDLLNAELIYNS